MPGNLITPPDSPNAAGSIADSSELLRAFLASKGMRTRSSYEDDLRGFADFHDFPTIGHSIDAMLNAGHGRANGLALAFRDYLITYGYAPATVNRRLAALRSVVFLARMLGFVSWVLDVPGVRAETYRDTRGPGIAGVRAMLDALDGRSDPKGVRDRAILRLLFDLGLRREEVCSLDVDDLDVSGELLWVMGKGKSSRLALTLPRPTLEALMAWEEVRAPGGGPLFTNFDRAGKGSRLTGHSLYRIVRDLGKQAGIEAPVRPHGLRHTAITAALDATGGDVRAVQRFSRHAKIETVTRYDDNRRDLGGQVARLVSQTV